ncbi:MAG: hypothetical protein ACKVX7_07870 [Planctomycetota bacterium]
MNAALKDAIPIQSTRRRRGRKICLWSGAAIGALTLVAFLWLRDIEPPDDRHAIPNWTLPLDPQNPLAQFQNWVDANPRFPEVAARVESLLATNSTSWKWREGDRLADSTTPPASPIHYLRAISVLLAASAKEKAAAGQLDEASRDALAILRLGRGLSAAEGNCILWLVSNMVAAVGTKSLLEVASQPAATLEQLAAWQAALTTSELTAETWAFALRVEYLSFKNSVSSLDGFLFKPNATLKMYLELMPPMVTNPNIPWASTRQICERNEARLHVEINSLLAFLRGNLIGEQLVNVASFSSSGLSRRYYQHTARHRISVCQLALRRYELTHGRLPDSLNDLVPEFFAEVPLDSFSTAPLRWNVGTKVIYSVGEDGIDAAGDVDLRNPYNGKDLGERYRWTK